MLVECGFTRATTGDGREFTFTPSLGRIADLGSPRELVQLFAEVHGADAGRAASYVLAGLCDQEDPLPLIGGTQLPADPAAPAEAIPALMPEAEQIVIAQHLLRHGMVGNARPGAKGRAEQGKYADEFNAAEYIAAAVVHLGMTDADAAGLSMTDFQTRFEMKFPDVGKKERDVPTREEYMAAMARMKERARG